MSREISTVGVVGLGTMGAGIVEVFARGGLTVIGVESTQEYAERGRGILQASTDRAVARGKLDEAGQAEILGRITITTEYAELAPVDLVVEAVPEIMSLKHEVIGKLEDVLREDAIVALVHTLAGPQEVLAVGTIFPDEQGKPSVHMHAASGREGAATVGCTRAGLRTWLVGEVVLLEISGSTAHRETDAASGFELLELP